MANDKCKRFEGEGVVMKAKLIGSELVMEPRGDKMCQNSIQRLKAIIKGTNSHKKRVVLKISFDGVKVFDEKTNEVLHHHEVSQISYIASDDTDNRTFGYVSDVPNKAHQFICFKTSGPAINVMSVISALFEAVLEKKNQQQEKEKEGSDGAMNTEGLIGKQPTGTGKGTGMDIITNLGGRQPKLVDTQQQYSLDLIGDSGIMDGDSSIASLSVADDKLLQQHPILLPPPSSLPRPTPAMMIGQPGAGHNRSLIYNHSSVSLSDAPRLTHNPSSFNSTASSIGGMGSGSVAGIGSSSGVGVCNANFGGTNSSNPSGVITTTNSANDSYVDRYAVFNDIDNLPSIFESTSLGNVNNASNSNNGIQAGRATGFAPLLEPLNSSSASAGNVTGIASSSLPLASSNTNNKQSTSSFAGVFRQTNPFDDDFFN